MSAVKLYIGTTPLGLSQETISLYFQSIVPACVFSLAKRQSHHGQAPCCFGFLFVESVADAQKLLSREHMIRGQKISCEECLTSREQPLGPDSLKHRRLFIRNMKKGTTKEDLETFFSLYGNLESIFIVKAQSTNKPRSFGYITFKTEHTAGIWLSKKHVEINGCKVYIHKFEKANDKDLSVPPIGEQPCINDWSASNGDKSMKESSQITKIPVSRRQVNHYQPGKVLRDSIPSSKYLSFPENRISSEWLAHHEELAGDSGLTKREPSCQNPGLQFSQF